MKKLGVLFLLAAFTLIPFRVNASEQFDTKYDVSYVVSDSGETQITQDIAITNKQSDVVATSYNLSINKMRIYDVRGTDRTGDLDFEVLVNGPTTEISTDFNEQVIGIDRTLNWTLNYKSKDISTKVGEIWNINIPKVDVLDVINEYNTTLMIPLSFGENIYISPKPLSETKNDNYYIFQYDKKSLEKTGITASFGSYQVLNFQLSYRLRNKSSVSTLQEIALPPNIKNKQQVKFETLDPLPEKIYTDGDGNMMALYRVEGKSSMEVMTTGAVRISGMQINPDFGGKFEEIEEKYKTYLKPQKYWEIESDPIKRIADNLYDETLNVTQNAQEAYNYVVDELDYNFEIAEESDIHRKGALKTIVEPGPVACMEFTDLFVSLARAMGIPAREINGYALTTESNLTPLSISLKSGDLLHSWAEFYDPNYGWVQVDPTWGNTSKIDYFTKLDTNHFVFVIKGKDSNYPYPAGTYKIKGTEKQVEVDIAQDVTKEMFKEQVTFYKKFSLNIIEILKGNRKYSVYNSGGIGIFNINNSGEDILPYETKEMFIKKDLVEVYYESFNGDVKYLKFNTEEGTPPTKNESSFSLYLSVVLALLLCTIVYVAAIHPESLKTLHSRLLRLLRARGR